MSKIDGSEIMKLGQRSLKLDAALTSYASFFDGEHLPSHKRQLARHTAIAQEGKDPGPTNN